MADLVVVKQAGTIVVDGVIQNVREGELFEADHPAVTKFSYLFGPVSLRFPMKRRTVEQATAAPGEKRKR